MTEGADAPGEAAGPAAAAGVPSRAAASPYSTGGGGVTLERRVAARYLALLLTGEGAPELEDGRAIEVAFQQAPQVPVDDLVILAARPDEMEPSLELAVGVRRAPNIVPSDEATQKLVVEYVRALLAAPADGREHRLAPRCCRPAGPCRGGRRTGRTGQRSDGRPGLLHLGPDAREVQAGPRHPARSP